MIDKAMLIAPWKKFIKAKFLLCKKSKKYIKTVLKLIKKRRRTKWLIKYDKALIFSSYLQKIFPFNASLGLKEFFQFAFNS